jgi:hypothetical protein
MKYTDQSSTELNHFLVNDIADPTTLRVLEKAEGLNLREPSFRWEIAILGSSHYLALHTPQGSITEIIACADTIKSNTPTKGNPIELNEAPEGNGKKHTFKKKFQGIIYRCVCTSLPFNINPLLEILPKEEIQEVVRMKFEFPKGNDHRIPFTEIVLEIPKNPEGLWAFQSTHAYPEENTIVRSTTIINPNK